MGAIPLAGCISVAVQAKLFHSIASIYGLELTRRLCRIYQPDWRQCRVGLLGRELLKFVLFTVRRWQVFIRSDTYRWAKHFACICIGVKRGALPDHATLKQATTKLSHMRVNYSK